MAVSIAKRAWSWLSVTLVALALSLATTSCDGVDAQPPFSANTRHIVVDTDMGSDDVMAILYLLARPDVQIDAVTVAGDGLSHCDPGVRNARAVLALAGSSRTPVACGRALPLVGRNAFPEEWRTYSDDLSSIPNLRVPTGDPYDGTAVDLLLEALDGDSTLLTLGPLTNVAEALRVDPDLRTRVPRVVAMAGAIDTAGNAPNGVAEYNVWIDSLAAKEVIETMPVELVPLDASKFVPVTSFFVDALGRHLDTPAARAIHALLETNEQIQTGTYFFWDPLAVAVAMEPELASWEKNPLLVTASLDAGAGWISRWEEGTETRYATRADGLRFERAFLSTVTGRHLFRVRPVPNLVVTFNGRRCWIDRTRILSGDVVVAFRNTSSGLASVILEGLHGTTYEKLLRIVGPPGSIVRRTPKGIVQIAWLDTGPDTKMFVETRVDPGDAGVFCVVPLDEKAGRVWPGGWVQIAPSP
jgi:pyrimidine-specific ribonucleoside hydrolase